MPVARNVTVSKYVRTFYMGIDPGLKGGVVILSSSDGIADTLRFEKATNHEIAEWVAKAVAVCNGGYQLKAALEKVGVMPAQGISSAFTFGTSYGFLKGLLTAFKIPYIDVTPQAWQKRLAIPKRAKEEDKTAFKKRLQVKAHQLWPKSIGQLTLATADAALIAEYLRLEEIGRLDYLV